MVLSCILLERAANATIKNVLLEKRVLGSRSFCGSKTLEISVFSDSLKLKEKFVSFKHFSNTFVLGKELLFRSVTFDNERCSLVVECFLETFHVIHRSYLFNLLLQR